jgi:recombination protein RecA
MAPPIGEFPFKPLRAGYLAHRGHRCHLTLEHAFGSLDAPTRNIFPRESMQRDLQRAIDAIHVRFGDQALVRATRLADVQPWPTGLSAVDRLSGIGGLPRGRVSVLQGPPGSGKLSLGLDLLARATHELSQTVVLDLHGGFDPWTLQPRDPDLSALVVVRPPNPSAAGEAAVALARAGASFLLVLDPLPESALAPLESAAAHSNCAVVVIDEGNDRALAHASSLTLGSERICWVWDRNLLVGLRARLACLKNKLAAPSAEAELEVRYALGAMLFTAEPVREVSERPDGDILELPQWRARSAAG